MTAHLAEDIPFGDDRPLPPQLSDAQLAMLANSNGTTPAPAGEHTWQPANLLTLAAAPPAPPTIGGLLYPGKRTVLSGETESMKTWLALILCKAELDIGHAVAWIDLDAMGPGALLDRLRLLGVDDQRIADDFLYYEPDRPLDDRHTEPIAELLQQRQVRLCVIDAFNPILGMHALDPNSTTDVEKFWQLYADPICQAGAAPVLLDHVVKNAETRGKYAYGSERKASGAIVHIGFKLLEPLTKGGRGRTLLNVHKDRPGYLQRPSLGRLVLTSTDDAITYELEPDKSHDQQGAFRPTVLMERLSRHLEQHHEPASKTSIEEAVPGKAEALRTALTTLVDEAYATAAPGPRNATLYTSIRPYREASDTPTTTPSPLRPHSVPDLRSRPTPSPSPPFKGTGWVEDPQDDPVPPPSPSPGQPIHEYDIPPIDEGQLDDLDLEPAPHPDDWQLS